MLSLTGHAALMPVSRQGIIIAVECGGESTHFVLARKQGEEKGPGIIHTFQSHTSSDPLSPLGPHFLKFLPSGS